MRKLFSLIAAVLFAGSMMAEEATMAAGTNGSACTVNDVAGIKCGTSSKGGDMTITVGAGATKLSFYAAAWKGVTGLSINFAADGVTFSPASVSLTADDGISNNTPFTLVGSAEDFKFEVELTGVTAETTIAVTSSAAKRFVVWGASYETGEVPPTPADTYTVAGSDAAIFGEAWNPALATNDMQKVNGIYKWEKAQLNLAVGSFEFKVAKNHSWDIAYPAQNYVVNIAEAGEYTITITFDPATEAVAAEAVKKEPVVIPQYEVAEAIAAGLADDAEIEVRGVVTKIQIKGKNFANYGSACIYVKDATGAEGEFEFYNCYSFDAAKFTSTVPAYDAESTAWAEFEEVADENGNAIHVGDTVIAFGKYKLYSGTHELNTGCYLTEIKHPGDAPVEEDNVIYDLAGEIGTTVLGATGVEVSTVKIHTNTDAVPAIKFGSSFVYAEGKWIAIKPAEGGFQAGDVLSVAAVFNNADDTKYAQIDLRAADGDTRIWLSDSASTINGRTQAGEPIVQTYTLEADQDSLFLGRYGNTAMFVTLLKVTRALVPPTPQPTINYYVIGSMTEWNVEANYKLVANPAVEGEYMGEFTFANNDEFKIVGDDGSQLIWYPGGTDNNFKITEAGDYKITFNPAGNVEGWYEGYFNVVKKVIPQYEVAEAIAAGLAEGDEVLVRGVISKMQIKGKNFAKYGSVNIYVTDATDAEGEFEFFNCFSFNADTFRTTTPAYDAEGTTWEDLKKVVDENGNEFRLGDTIVAFGKYKLYNTTHELTACYITDLKPAPVEPGQTIEVNMSEGLRFVDYVAAEGWWELYGDDGKYIIDLSNVSTEQIAGEYPIDNLDPDYCYLGIINGEDTTYVTFVDGAIILTVSENGDVTVTGTLVGDDDNNYVLNLAYVVPTAKEEVSVSIANGESYDEYADYGLYAVYGEDENEVYVQLAIWAENGFEGNFTEADLDVQYIGSFIYDGEEYVEIYSATITVTPADGGGYNIVATILGYNNKQYNVTMYVPGGEGIEETLAAGKAAKVLRDGQVLILKGDKTFNVMGARIR